jgi:hypothetical protein
VGNAVRIGEGDDLTPGFSDPGIAGRVGTLNPVLDQRDDREFPYDAKSVVPGIIVDDDDFPFRGRITHIQ